MKEGKSGDGRPYHTPWPGPQGELVPGGRAADFRLAVTSGSGVGIDARGGSGHAPQRADCTSRPAINARPCRR